MNSLHAKDYQGRKVIDSRDVAQMVGKSHKSGFDTEFRFLV